VLRRTQIIALVSTARLDWNIRDVENKDSTIPSSKGCSDGAWPRRDSTPNLSPPGGANERRGFNPKSRSKIDFHNPEIQHHLTVAGRATCSVVCTILKDAGCHSVILYLPDEPYDAPGVKFPLVAMRKSYRRRSPTKCLEEEYRVQGYQYGGEWHYSYFQKRGPRIRDFEP
jgi:hypothetical protein